MTERERLIDLIRKGIDEHSASTNRQAFDRYLADRLLSNGVIVPPCKVGDKIYTLFSWDKKVFETTVHAISTNSNKNSTDILLCAYDEDRDNARYSSAWIGKTVFLTREEAEKALKERSKGE